MALGDAAGSAAEQVAEEAGSYGGVTLPSDPQEVRKLLESLKTEMFQAAAKREFERAAQLRDTIKGIQERLLSE